MAEGDVKKQPKSTQKTDAALQKKEGSGLEPNIAAPLCYLFGWITGLIFLVIEKKNDLVRFHAMQSILLSLVFLVVWVVLAVVFGVLFFVISIVAIATMGIGSILYLVLGLLAFVVWVAPLAYWLFVMYKAYKLEKYLIPFIGTYAEQYSKTVLAE